MFYSISLKQLWINTNKGASDRPTACVVALPKLGCQERKGRVPIDGLKVLFRLFTLIRKLIKILKIGVCHFE